MPRRLPPLVRDGDDSASSLVGSGSKKHINSVHTSEDKKDTIISQHESVEQLMIGQLRSVLKKSYVHE